MAFVLGVIIIAGMIAMAAFSCTVLFAGLKTVAVTMKTLDDQRRQAKAAQRAARATRGGDAADVRVERVYDGSDSGVPPDEVS